MLKLLPLIVVAMAAFGATPGLASNVKSKPTCPELRAIHAKAKHDGRYVETRRAARRIRAAGCH